MRAAGRRFGAAPLILSLLLLLIVQAAGFAVVRSSIDRNARAQIAQGIDLLHDQSTITAHVSSAGILDTATGEVLPLAVLQSHR